MPVIVDDGTVAVEVSGKTYELTPSLAAVRGVTRALGGLRPAAQRVQDLDFDAMAAVIIAGAGLKLKASEADEMVEAIWKGDSAAIGGACLDFVVLLLRGGQVDEPKKGKSSGN